jgi:nucleoside-diphosphate-sugar epimerase
VDEEPAVPRILLTGATGFIGRTCVAPLIARGFEVHTIIRHAARESPGVIAHPGDLLAIESLPDLIQRIAPSHLLHVAWDVTHGAYWTSRKNLAWVASSCVLLRVFLEAGGTRAVGVGSCAEYAWTREIYPEDEPALLDPATPYGRAKLAVYHTFAAANALGVSTAWGRIFFPYGPGEPEARLLPSVIGGILRGQPVPITIGAQVRDLMYCDDVGEALAALVTSDVAGAVNIASGRGYALREVVAEITRQLGGAEYIQLGAIAMRDGDVPAIVGDVRRLSKEVGFGLRTCLADGIARTIAHWRERFAISARRLI